MKTIFLVRHGESEANVGPHFSDDNAPLTAKGRKQAQFIAERVSRLPIDVLISSSMARTKETAAYISAAINLPVEYSDMVVERKYPTALVGLPRQSNEGSKMWDEWTASCFENAPRILDGETFDDLKARALATLAMLERRTEKNILVVSHGSFSKFICAAAIYGDMLAPTHTGALFGGLRVNYTGLTILHFDPVDERKPWWVSVWNDHAHLG